MLAYDEITGRLETLQDRIELLGSKRITERRARRLERLQNRVLKLQKRLDKITPDPITSYSTKDSEDLFGITMRENGVDIEIYDSEVDDTFTGGDPLLMQVQATRRKANGGFETMTQRTTLANGSYWEGSSQQTIYAGGSVFDKLQGFDQFTVTVAIDDGKRPMGFDQDDILAVQTFSSTDLI